MATEESGAGDLRAAMAEVRELVLIASTWAKLASRAALAGESPDRVRWLIGQTEEAAVYALERVKAIDSAIGAA